MSKSKNVEFNTARIAVYNENKRITRIGWDKGVYLIKGTSLFFIMRTTNNKLITYIPTKEDESAKDWIILN